MTMTTTFPLFDKDTAQAWLDKIVGVTPTEIQARLGDFMQSHPDAWSKVESAVGGVDIAALAGKLSQGAAGLSAAGGLGAMAGGSGALAALKTLDLTKLADLPAMHDLLDHVGQAGRLYQAAFDRQADIGGLEYWVDFLAGGGSLADAAAGFVNSPEFKARFGESPNTTELVTKFYDNVLHRAPDQAGLEYWTNQIESGLKKLPEVLSCFSESPENQVNLVGIVGDLIAQVQAH